MAVIKCSTNQMSTPRFTLGRGGCQIQAIVLRDLGMSAEQYLNWVCTRIAEDYHTKAPKSVHYIVGNTGGDYALVDDTNTAWAIDHFDPSYPNWQINCGNAQFIYVGVEGGNNITAVQYDSLVNLLCCLSIKHNLPVDNLHIIVENDIDSFSTGILELPQLLLADVAVCRANNGLPPIPNINDLADRIDALEECCSTLRASFLSLQAYTNGLPDRINALEGRMNEAENKLGDHANRIGALEGQITALQDQILSLTNILQDHQACIDKVCPVPDKCKPITYTLDPSNSMLLTPNVPVWVNFPNKIEDTPAKDSVIPGPLWAAKLECQCNYAITVTIGLEPSEYCDGKSVWLDVVAGGVTYRVETVIPGVGNSTVSMSGTIPLSVPPVVNDVHVMVGTNDVTTPFKTIRYGNINIRCV